MNERGFTLIELLVGVTMALIVFGIVGTTLVAYQRDAPRSVRQNDSQDQARVLSARIIRELRNVASSRTAPSLVEAAGPYDLVFQTVGSPSGQNTAGLVRRRYCVPSDSAPGTETNAAMTVQQQTWTTATAPANPWPIAGGASTACPFAPASVPAGSSISTSRAAGGVRNRFAGANRPVFSYDSTALATITTVGIDLFVDTNATQPPAETELRSSAFVRNQNQIPVASFTATPTGGGHVLLNGGGSSDPDNQQLTFKWFRVGTAAAIGTSGLLDWAPGAGTYTVRLEVTDPGGLTASETKTVSVS